MHFKEEAGKGSCSSKGPFSDVLTFLTFAVSTSKAKGNGSPQTSCLVAFCLFLDISPAQLYGVLRCTVFFGCFAGFVLFQCPDG